MKYLLDTHTFLWALDSPEKLSRRAYTIVSEEVSQLYISIATPWELAIKANLGRLEIDELLNNFESMVSSAGYELLETRVSHVIRAGSLPGHHRDPFDRLLIAQSIEMGMALVSCDETLDRYGVKRIWQ